MMHKAGYVHRDLSTGNLFWMENGKGEGRGKISDFEYARVMCRPEEPQAVIPEQNLRYITVSRAHDNIPELPPQISYPGHCRLHGV